MNVCKHLNYKFAHHHLHTEYSPFDAPVGLKKMVEYSKHLGYKTVTVSDHGTVSSWVKLAGLCKENGLKPIFALEGYFVENRHEKKGDADGGRGNRHCLLIAKTSEGVKNIYRLSELAYREGWYFDPRFDWELLEKYHEGVICTTSCISGHVPNAFTLAPTDAALAVLGPDGKQIIDEKGPRFMSNWDLAMKRAKRFQSIFGKDFYAEVQCHGIGAEAAPYAGVAKIAKELDLKIVGTNDVHYLRKGDANTQEIMMAISFGKCIKAPVEGPGRRLRHETNQLYLKSPDEMTEIFGGKNRPAVMGALEIAETCNAELNNKTQLPSIEIPKEYKTELDYLVALARAGMKRIGKQGDPVYEARFNEEIEVIRRLRDKGRQFDRYFLIVHDYVDWAWKNGIRVGVGRGSGCGSLILYCLRITGLDPIPYDLLFERFLDEDRNEMPDIDIDFESEKGYLVFQYACKKYGDDKVARVGNFHFYHVASAIRTAFRAFDSGNHYEQEQKEKQAAAQTRKLSGKKGIQIGEKKSKERNETAALANTISKLLPREPGQKGPSPRLTLLREKKDKNPDDWDYVYDVCPEVAAYRDRFPLEFALAETLEGLLEKRGIHAAGVLITKDPLVEVCPQQRSSKAGDFATAFDMNDVDKVGGVKFDFLSTKVLSVLTRTLEMVDKRYGKTVDIDNVPVDDRPSLALFERGDTTGIFQFESDGMRKMLRDMRSITFEDVIAANALYRPGPMVNIPSYCRRKKGEEPVSFVISALEKVLKPTLGIIVYQEQVIRAVRVLAGFTASEADKVRKAMGKKKKDILDQMKEKFIKGCDTMKTCSKPIAESLWETMEKFAAYAFNKSHAAGYSYTAYQCAYLKAHYPEEFMACQMTVEAGDGAYETIEEYEHYTQHGMSIKVLPPDINLAKRDYQVLDRGEKKVIVKGFKGVMGVGSSYADIEAGQPYSDMWDFCTRGGAGTGTACALPLLDDGGFDCFLPGLTQKLKRKANRSDLQAEYNDKKRRAENMKNAKGAKAAEQKIPNVFGFEEGKPTESFSL